MQILRTIAAMRLLRRTLRCEAPAETLALVPTMGALHEGHLSLIRAAKSSCDRTAVSLFVNPLQFAPGEDFTDYPRTFEADCAQLEREGVDYLFAPTPEEMYPPSAEAIVDVPGIGSRLDGTSRPGHFRGVATIVTKLFHIVQPDSAYFGQKDAAQVAVLRAMVRDLNFDIDLVVCPTVRDADCLALSSRNRNLSSAEREQALAIPHSLLNTADAIADGQTSSATLRALLLHDLREAGLRIDYAAIVDPQTLEPVIEATPGTLLAVAAYAGTTRLIDNLIVPDKKGDEAMKILLGVTGGIAAYKAAELTRELQRQGADVQIVMTASAERFITPLTFASLSGHQVLTSLWHPSPEATTHPESFDIEHIAIAQQIDALVIAPATANTIAKLAHGIADDLLTTIALATTAPILVAPAMNVNMWHHPATQQNLATLRAREVHIVEPDTGALACGMTGEGRLADPTEIADAVLALTQPLRDLTGETILITAGGTREPIDPVRYLGNRSSGRMGFALAEAALRRGASVILITAAPAPASLTCETHSVTTAAEMQFAALAHSPAPPPSSWPPPSPTTASTRHLPTS